jgi:DNA (cytosine-5)-methyltransferase 1
VEGSNQAEGGRVTAYYNEHDPRAAAWLRELIGRNLIAPGDVDERDIRDVVPVELFGYGQCHFFAGIGVWSHALRNAGWPDDRPVWTGSCPCQPFSAAGGRAGFADERHLWPAWFHLIGQCRPRVVFGEQVASAAALDWLDLVWTDMEAAGYAFGAVDLCAAGVGAPHIRQRLYWVADAERGTAERHGLDMGSKAGRVPGSTWKQRVRARTGDGRNAGLVGDTSGEGLEGRGVPGCGRADERPAWQAGGAGVMADAGCVECQRREDEQRSGRADKAKRHQENIHDQRCGPTGGFWRDADWIDCRDGKARPVEPGSFPLVDRATARVVRLRGYGNAIVAPLAEAFVRAYLDSVA